MFVANILMSHIRYSEVNHLKINYFQLLYIIKYGKRREGIVPR